MLVIIEASTVGIHQHVDFTAKKDDFKRTARNISHSQRNDMQTHGP